MQHDHQTEAFARLKHDGLSLDAETWSEADTRSKLIDTLLKDCLGWQEPDIERELSNDALRLDYRLSTAAPLLVVEAKRAAIDLKIIAGHQPRTVKLSSLLKANPSLKKPIVQVARYCHNWSLPFGLLTNGRTYILFSGARTDSRPWRRGKAIVFRDIGAEDCDFADLHVLLSRDSVTRGSLDRRLLSESPVPIPPTVLSMYSDPNAVVPRNRIAVALDHILTELFTDVGGEESPEILKHCYVKPGETTLRNETLEYPLLDTSPANIQAREVVDVASSNAFQHFQSVITSRLGESRGSVMILIGDTGVGKTFFLRRFFSRECNPDLSADVLPFMVDYRYSDVNPTHVVAELYRTLRKQLDAMDDAAQQGRPEGLVLSGAEDVRQIFKSELMRFSNRHSELRKADAAQYELKYAEKVEQLLQKDEDYVKCAFEYIREHYHRKPCIVLDNADHHTSEFQATVYSAAHALEHELRVPVIISLQEGWYWHFRQDGPLSSYQDAVFHIPAPRMKDILERRLTFAISNVKRYMSGPIREDLGTNTVVEITPEVVAAYLRKCKDAFFAKDEIAVCYECVANGDVRRGLDFFATFFRSGHTRARDCMLAITKQADFAFSLDEVVRSMACGEFRYYRGSRSSLVNPLTLDPATTDQEYSRFAPLYLLEYLSGCVRRMSSAGSGFVSKQEVLAFLETLGIQNDRAIELLMRLRRSLLVKTPAGEPVPIAEAPFFRISGYGYYLTRTLMRMPVFVELVMLDTPIRDSKMFATVLGAYREGSSYNNRDSKTALRSFVTELVAVEEREYPRLARSAYARSFPPIASELTGLFADEG